MSVRSSLLPAGLTLVGSIEGKGDLVVAGAVEGPIELEGDLVIEEGGAVRGDVRASSLVVRGVLTGDASAKVAVRVEPSAAVVGDVSAPRVNIVEGARVRGRVTMTGEPAVPAMRRRRRAPEAEVPSALPEDEAFEAAPTPAPAPAAPTPAPTPAPAPKLRRRRRRGARKPPPPTIPTVQRQKARRKDRAPFEPAT